MKRLYRLGLVISIVLLLTSCGNEPPVFNENGDPFIVGEISEKDSRYSKDGKFSIYYKNTYSGSGTSVFGSWYQAVVLPSGMYNIGDTIVMQNKKQ